MARQQITERDLQCLLAAKHGKDLFVPNCKNGPTHGTRSLGILDGWAFRRSWANPCCTGYEIKVERGDWIRDTKWRGYLRYCNELYFVCPPDVIKPEEVPDAAGLLVCSRNGTRLYTKRKAPYHNHEVDPAIFRYVLMCRATIDAPTEPNSSATWRRWLEQKDEDKRLGWNVSRKLREIVAERIDAVRQENHQLRRRIGELERIEDLCKRMEFDPCAHYDVRDAFKRKVRENGGGPFLDELMRLMTTAQRLHSILSERT